MSPGISEAGIHVYSAGNCIRSGFSESLTSCLYWHMNPGTKCAGMTKDGPSRYGGRLVFGQIFSKLDFNYISLFISLFQ